MEEEQANNGDHGLRFDLGTFEGFNFRSQSAIFPNHSAEEVVNWDHDKDGEAEFWPAGDRPEVQLILKSGTVTGSELLALDGLLEDLGGDTEENFLRIHYAVNVLGCQLGDLTASDVEDEPIHIFFGSSFSDVRKGAAYELFELYYPEAYAAWEKSTCDGLVFDEDRFLDSPSLSTEEVRLGDGVALIVAAQ